MKEIILCIKFKTYYHSCLEKERLSNLLVCHVIIKDLIARCVQNGFSDYFIEKDQNLQFSLTGHTIIIDYGNNE